MMIEDIISEYPILSKIFILDEHSKNEIYASLFKYVYEKYTGLFTPINKMPDFVIKYASDLMDYYETEFGLPFNGEYKVVLRPVVNNSTLGLPSKSNIKKIKIDKDKVKSYLGYIDKKINVKNKIEVLGIKPEKFLVLLDPRTPLIDAIYIIAHEMAHVYSLNQVWQPLLNLQILHHMSAQEMLAVTLSFKYLADNNFYYHYGMSVNLVHYEYYTYSKDFLRNPRNLLNYAKEILENDILVGTESIERYNFSKIVRLIKFYSLLYNITVLNGSFIRRIPLEEILLTDYMFMYYILNIEEFIQRFKNVYNLLQKSENNVKTYHPDKGETTLKDLILYLRNEVLDKLIDYNPDDNTISQKQSFELFSYYNAEQVLLK